MFTEKEMQELLFGYSDEYEYPPEKENTKKKCTCGAVKTRNKNLHSDWCDLYENDN